MTPKRFVEPFTGKTLACLPLALLLALPYGCAPRRSSPPLPEIPPAPAPQERAERRPPPRVPEERVGPGEAPLGSRRDGAAVPDEEPLPETPPSVVAMIDASTPSNVAAATRLVEASRKDSSSGDSETAIEKLERAIAVDPNNPYAYYFLAEAHFRRGTYDQSIAFAEKAALLSARTSPSWLSRSYALQGQVFEAAGRFADARNAYRKAVAADPRNRVAAQRLGRLGGDSAGAP